MDSASVKVFVDGRQVRVPVGFSILDACDHAGTYVPRLCAYPGLEPLGDCGLCFVKVDGGAARRACSVTVAPGMRVDTRDEKALGLRAASMRDILGDHPHVCLTCPDRDGCSRDECTYGEPPETRCCGEFGRCEIARVASHVGALESASTFTFRSLGEPTVDHTIRRDLELCIGCGRCVAACDTLEEAGSALQLVETRSCRDGRPGRGGRPGFVADWEPRSYLGRNVAVPKEADLRLSGCTFCGACVMVCPTGALTAQGKHGGAWLAKRGERSTLRNPVLPPEMRHPYNAGALAVVPALEGVFRLYSVAGECLQISGVMDLAHELREAVYGPLGSEVHSFDFEIQAMYTQRECELLARHLQEHGGLPRGNDALGGAFDDDEENLL